jgi:aminopeptidase-like protein
MNTQLDTARAEQLSGIDINAGAAMHQLMTELYPICRSITGDGFRHTMKILQSHLSLDVHEVPTGTQVYDWRVPREWNIRDAYVKNPQGEKIIDFARSNLHVLNYSIPVHDRLSLAELKTHLYSLPAQPDLIPYRTSYYKDNWGFCVPHRLLETLGEGEYEVFIDSTLQEGHLTYGEYVVRGETQDEVLISCHSCHPSLCNDNLSGISLTTFLAKVLTGRRLRYTYRFLFIPGAIGSITWLARNEASTQRIHHGLVVACVGDPGSMTYKKSRRGNAPIDCIVEHVLKHSGQPYSIREFSPYGYDERQYCSPGFNLPVGSLTRTPHGEFPEYHTSADNLEFVRPEFLADSLSRYLSVIRVLEGEARYLNTNPKCEPQLGKRGLYSATGGLAQTPQFQLALLWVLNLSDGSNSLLDIAERSELSFDLIREAATALIAHDLLRDAAFAGPDGQGDGAKTSA